MPSLEDRELRYVHTCPTCKHCWDIDIDYDEPPYTEFFCMLGVSEEDKELVRRELDNIPKRCNCSGSDLSEKALQIMKWEDPEELPPYSERLVSISDCCQFYDK